MMDFKLSVVAHANAADLAYYSKDWKMLMVSIIARLVMTMYQ